MTVQYHEDQPDQPERVYDYVMPDAYDPESSLPLELSDEAPDSKPAPTSVSTDKGLSVADRLRQDFGSRTVPTVDIPVPQREGWVLRFRLDWSESKTEKWRKQAKDRTVQDGISREKLSLALLADQCIAVILDGDPIVIGGERWTFQSKGFQEELDVHTPMQAVKKVLPIYAQLIAVADQVSAAAGQGDALDPM